MFENLTVPADLRPHDGRFGSGPSRIHPSHVAALSSASQWGTSHRKDPVIDLTKSIQAGLAELFSIPDGYEIVLGVGGASAFWAVAAVSLVRDRAHLASFGEFGAKFAADVDSSPWAQASVLTAPAGELARVTHAVGADVYAYTHNETSTGVASDIYGAPEEEALTVVDAVSIAGAAEVDLSLVDAYYFSPQKCFGSDGGLWVAILSPAALERAAELAKRADRPQFGFLSLHAAAKTSRKGQLVNTPAVGTLLLLDQQVRWMLDSGGIPAMAAKSQAGASALARWTDSRDFARLFVNEPAWRSPVVTTIEFDHAIPVADLSAALRRSGIVDVDGYRGIGQNQLRISSFPSVETEDIEALTRSIDWLVGQA